MSNALSLPKMWFQVILSHFAKSFVLQEVAPNNVFIDGRGSKSRK